MTAAVLSSLRRAPPEPVSSAGCDRPRPVVGVRVDVVEGANLVNADGARDAGGATASHRAAVPDSQRPIPNTTCWPRRPFLMAEIPEVSSVWGHNAGRSEV